MAKNKVTEAKITDLKFDSQNANLGTQFGDKLLEKSIEEVGLGRSVVIDQDNNIIGGNHVVAKAGEMGFENVIIVETDGKTLVAVKRTDLNLDSEEGRKMALLDNKVSEENLRFDMEVVEEITSYFDLDPKELGFSQAIKKSVTFNAEIHEKKCPHCGGKL